MSHSEKDDFDKDQTDGAIPAEGMPESSSPEEKDPFADLANLPGEGDENEGTMTRLGHLISDEPQNSEGGESTTQRLSHLLSDEDPGEDSQENTAMKLSRLIGDDSDSDADEDTASRLGNFMADWESTPDEETSPSEEPVKMADGGAPPTPGAEEDFGDASDPFGAGGYGNLSAPLSDEFSDLAERSDVPQDETPTGKPTRKAKPKKERKPRYQKKGSQPKTGVDYLLMAVNILILLLIIAGNVWAFVFAKGINIAFFGVLFNFLGLLLFLAPYLLAVRKRRDGAISLYDSMLALSLVLLILGCMLLLAVQSHYGLQIKGGSGSGARVLVEKPL